MTSEELVVGCAFRNILSGALGELGANVLNANKWIESLGDHKFEMMSLDGSLIELELDLLHFLILITDRFLGKCLKFVGMRSNTSFY